VTLELVVIFAMFLLKCVFQVLENSVFTPYIFYKTSLSFSHQLLLQFVIIQF